MFCIDVLDSIVASAWCFEGMLVRSMLCKSESLSDNYLVFTFFHFGTGVCMRSWAAGSKRWGDQGGTIRLLLVAAPLVSGDQYTSGTSLIPTCRAITVDEKELGHPKFSPVVTR
jgi:hypothetical protein